MHRLLLCVSLALIASFSPSVSNVFTVVTRKLSPRYLSGYPGINVNPSSFNCSISEFNNPYCPAGTKMTDSWFNTELNSFGESSNFGYFYYYFDCVTNVACLSSSWVFERNKKIKISKKILICIITKKIIALRKLYA